MQLELIIRKVLLFINASNSVDMKGTVSRVSWYAFLAYWIIQAIFLIFFKGFGSLPIIMSAIIILLCLIGLFMKGPGYKVGTSIIFFLYSIVLCIMFILLYLFFHPRGSGNIIYLIFLLIILLNFTLSALMIKQAKKEIEE